MHMEARMASVAAQTYLTPEEYLTFERKATTKHEYLNGQIVAMSGASGAAALYRLWTPFARCLQTRPILILKVCKTSKIPKKYLSELQKDYIILGKDISVKKSLSPIFVLVASINFLSNFPSDLLCVSVWKLHIGPACDANHANRIPKK